MSDSSRSFASHTRWRESAEPPATGYFCSHWPLMPRTYSPALARLTSFSPAIRATSLVVSLFSPAMR